MMKLQNRPMDSIVKSLGKLSENWLSKDFPYRKKAMLRLEKRSGFTRGQSEALLDALFSELTTKKLYQLLRMELRDPAVLDDFSKGVRAHGPRLITHIFAGNVPNPAIVSFILGMLTKSANVGKVSSKDPGILDIYLESLRGHDPELAKTNRIIRSNVHDWIKKSGLVVAYGSDESLEEIKKIVPLGTPFCGYGHRVSFSLYTREALNRKNISRLASQTAKDVWMADQRGCLSPSIIYVENGGEVLPFEFAARVKRCLDKVTGTFGDRHSNHNRMPVPKGASHLVWTVLFDDKPGKFPLSGGRRIIFIRGFKKIDQVYKEIAPMKKYLQAVALKVGAGFHAGPKKREDITEHLADLGVNRICRAGRMQFPPITWHHDGKFNLASWLRWTDLT